TFTPCDSDNTAVMIPGTPVVQSLHAAIRPVNNICPILHCLGIRFEFVYLFGVMLFQVSAQIVELFEACRQQSSDLYRKETCRAQLQKDIKTLYPDARLYLTGSTMSGLGCRSSDADLCLVVGLKVGIYKFLQVLLIRAKVPILRFKEKGSNLEFDLNVNNTVGIRNTFLLRSYTHVLKPCVLPSLQRDHPVSACFDPSLDLDMVPDASHRVPHYKSKNKSSLGDLFLGFLKYYAYKFRWDSKVISVRDAITFAKVSPDWRGKFICVEEPFEMHNVARAVHEKAKFDAIKARFDEVMCLISYFLK
uniref:polynucleotide adenylyltransferase n=1 Tax=Periophthalmus magnuspinnatus TaxID=409849 RepID=A0A3B4BCE1_9GOBI